MSLYQTINSYYNICYTVQIMVQQVNKDLYSTELLHTFIPHLTLKECTYQTGEC